MILGNQLKNAIISAANNISRQKKHVNDLNIFPVPDGDTGTNMSLTIQAASSALKELSNDADVETVAKTAASAMLRGARGNSGVILSLLFRGFSKGMVGRSMIGSEALVDSLDIGVDESYHAVSNPTEGTILTVARVAAERGREALDEADSDVLSIWSAVCTGAYEALEETPELLPVLKKAGVVDAGGKGLCLIFDGMMSVFRSGIIVEEEPIFEDKTEEIELFFQSVAAEFDQDINFTYCTEFVIRRDSTVLNESKDLKDYLLELGDSVVVVDDEDIIKVHVHTENPGLAVQKALDFGELITIKVDNMKEQHRKLTSDRTGTAESSVPHTETLEPQDPVESVGFVSVAAGEGLKRLFTDLGCSHVIRGGQTMNPSTESILEAILATPAKNVFVLPNNKNILLAAEQTIPLVKDRNVFIIPTRTIPQGLSSMLAFEPDADSELNLEQMTEAASHVDTGTVTFAARDSEFGGHNIRSGEILGLKNGKLTLIEKDPIHTCVRLTKSMCNKNTSFITIIYGNGMTLEQAEQAKKSLSARISDDIEINLVNGMQPLYYFIISVE